MPHSMSVERVFTHSPDGRLDRRPCADVAVEQQREGDDGRAQHDDGEDEPDGIADEDHRPAAFTGQHVPRRR